MNNKISESKYDIKIFNAGIEGQSTRGHISNLKYWFPKLKDFKPKYIIYYIGVNDQYADKNLRDEFEDGNILKESLSERLADNIKSRSLFYDLLRKLKHKYYTSDKKILYDFDAGIKKYKKNNINFLSYKEFKKKDSLEKVLLKHQDLTRVYIKRVDKLHEESIKFGAIPIFINQLAAEGFHNSELVALNSSLIIHCKKKNYKCIDVASELNGKFDFWWDGIHTTPKGSRDSQYNSLKFIKILDGNLLI